MLRSPGHSPRELSPSPSPAPATPRPSSPTPSSASALSTTTSSKRRCPEVLDEDTYVATIERIIERDFFPDLPRLRDRLDWLQAVRSRDPLVLRDAQLKIPERRRRVRRLGPAPTPTPATSTTLRSPSFLATPLDVRPRRPGRARGINHRLDPHTTGPAWSSCSCTDAALSGRETRRRGEAREGPAWSSCSRTDAAPSSRETRRRGEAREEGGMRLGGEAKKVEENKEKVEDEEKMEGPRVLGRINCDVRGWASAHRAPLYMPCFCTATLEHPTAGAVGDANPTS